ncbi:MAG TPA: LacI family DNA-binding transcriptional regulator [Jiangellales bacterium]|nr:LacI family DNA-binding transcriptional regulator [Jiangellales bacterium]
MSRNRATLADVARLAGLSKTAASMVLNGREGTRLSADAHRRVFAAAAELGYRPNVAARSLRTQRSSTLAFISDIVATTRFAGDMIRGALDAAREHDHVLLIAETQGDESFEQHAIDAMLDRQVDGVIYAAMATRELTVPAALLGRPTVLLNAASAQGLPCVLPDDEQAGRAVVSALLEAGHRDRIALIGRNRLKERDPEVSLAARARLRGIERTLQAAGVTLCASVSCHDWLPEHGFAAMRSLIRKAVRPSVVICMNDRLAFGAYQAIAEAGLGIPQDVSVVSFDDDAIAAWLRPGLSTAALPHEQMGRRAVEVLLGEANADRCLVPMPLRARGSVGAPTPP